MRIFFDTNVLVAAYATHGACNELLNHCIARHQIILSDFVLKELENKLVRKIKLTRHEAGMILSFLRRNCEIAPKQTISSMCRDKDDDHILAAAIGGKVDCLLTGDKDLLTLRNIEGIPILIPADFWKIEF